MENLEVVFIKEFELNAHKIEESSKMICNKVVGF